MVPDVQAPELVATSFCGWWRGHLSQAAKSWASGLLKSTALHRVLAVRQNSRRLSVSRSRLSKTPQNIHSLRNAAAQPAARTLP